MSRIAVRIYSRSRIFTVFLMLRTPDARQPILIFLKVAIPIHDITPDKSSANFLSLAAWSLVIETHGLLLCMQLLWDTVPKFCLEFWNG